MSICYRLGGRLWRTARGYYVLYLHVRDAPPELRALLESLVRKDVEIAIICP